jgi:Zn-dependent M28 family amino/carboxypeptidase
MKRLLLATALIAAPILAHASDAPKIDPAKLAAHIKTLSSDAFEGRGPATAGETKTVAYITEQMKAVGLEPGGDLKDGKRLWTQDVPLGKFDIDGPVMAHVMVGADHIMLNQGEQVAIRAAMTNVNAVSIKDAPIVFAGYGVKAPERNWDDFKAMDLKGKVVVVLINDPDFETGSGDFGGKAMTYYGRWTYKFEEAARQGAAAALIVHDTAPAAYGWNVVNSSWTGPQFLAQSKNGGADQTKANGWVQKDVAAQIMAAGGQDLAKAIAAAKKKGFKALPLNLKASVSFENAISKKNSRNIVGVLKGAKRPDEYVLYTAHWDHLGRCTPVDGDDICNGAVDNATGTAALVALAEAHKKAGAPDRSIIFLAVTAEESGLLGSKYYAENPIYPLAKTVGGVNMDAFSMTGPAKNLTVIGMGKSDLDSYLNAAAKVEGRTPDREPTPEKGFYYRSDHFSFAKLGVPMVYFEGGDDLVNGGKEAAEKAAKDYEENRYHAPGDEFDESWDWSGVMADLRLYYRVGRMLAMTTAWPNWVEGDEFRAIRDKSRAAK